MGLGTGTARGIQHRAEGQVVVKSSRGAARGVGCVHLVRVRQEGKVRPWAAKELCISSTSTLPSALRGALYGHLLSHTDIPKVERIPSAVIQDQSLVHTEALLCFKAHAHPTASLLQPFPRGSVTLSQPAC